MKLTVEIPDDLARRAAENEREVGYTPESLRAATERYVDGDPAIAVVSCLARAALLEQWVEPEWEPTEEQVTAYCKRRGLNPFRTTHQSIAANELKAARAVLEGESDG